MMHDIRDLLPVLFCIFCAVQLYRLLRPWFRNRADPIYVVPEASRPPSNEEAIRLPQQPLGENELFRYQPVAGYGESSGYFLDGLIVEYDRTPRASLIMVYETESTSLRIGVTAEHLRFMGEGLLQAAERLEALSR
jgi:hypothetical protein